MRGFCDKQAGSLLYNYGSASTMIRKRKVPVVWIPSKNRTLMLAPFASGVPSVIVPADTVEL